MLCCSVRVKDAEPRARQADRVVGVVVIAEHLRAFTAQVWCGLFYGCPIYLWQFSVEVFRYFLRYPHVITPFMAAMYMPGYFSKIVRFSKDTSFFGNVQAWTDIPVPRP